MPTSYNATHSHRSPFPSIFHSLASVFFSHPCWLRPLGATTVTCVSQEVLNERMESSGRFFRGNFYALAIVKLSTSFLSRKRSLVARSCKRLLWHIRVSICLVDVFLSSDLSNFFLERRKSVSSSFLFEYACNWEIENCFSRSISCIAERERVYKEFLKRLRKKNRILKSFFLLSFLQYRITNSIVYNYHTVNQKIT